MQVWFVTQDQEGHSHREKYCHALVRKHRIRFYILLSVCLHGEQHGALMVTVRFTKLLTNGFRSSLQTWQFHSVAVNQIVNLETKL